MSEEFSRRVLSGVIEYYRDDRTVEVLAISADDHQNNPVISELDGIIAVINPQMANYWLAASSVPWVMVTRLATVPGVTTVTSHQVNVATEAVEHFESMRLQNIAMCTDPKEGDVTASKMLFMNELSKKGCASFRLRSLVSEATGYSKIG